MTESSSNLRPVELRAVQPRRQVCLLILGMHRSGTSALSRVLNIAGADLPAHLVGPNDGNTQGHWEPMPLVTYHDQILEEVGSHHLDWLKLDIARLEPQRLEEIGRHITRLVRSEFGQASLFVLKDPRVSRFAELYLDVLRSAEIDPRVIVSVRNPLEVCLSLEKRNQVSRSQSAMLWLRYTIDAEINSRKARRTFVRYADLVEDWQSVLGRVKAELALDELRDFAEIGSLVDDFLSSKHRHHSCSSEDLQHDPVLSGWVTTVWEAMLVLVRDPKSQRAMDQISDVARQIDQIEPFLLDWHHDLYGKLGESEKLKHDWFEPELQRLQKLARDYEQTKNEWWDPEIARLSAALARSELREAEHYQPRLAEFEKQAAEARQETEAARQKIGVLESELAGLREQLAERERVEQEELRPETARLSAALAEATRREHEKLEPRIAALTRQLEEARRGLPAQQRDSTLKQLQELRHRLIFRIDENRFLERKLRQMEARLDEEAELRASWLQPEIARLLGEEARLLGIIEDFERIKVEWWDPHIAELEGKLAEMYPRLERLSVYERSRFFRLSQAYYRLFGIPVIGPMLHALRSLAKLVLRR